jgi:hypothetical protein
MMSIRMAGLGLAWLATACVGAGGRDDARAGVSSAPQVTTIAVQRDLAAETLAAELKLVERLTARIEILRAHERELIGYGYQREPEAARRQWERSLEELGQRLVELDEAGAITTPTALSRLRENVMLPLDELREKE